MLRFILGMTLLSTTLISTTVSFAAEKEVDFAVINEIRKSQEEVIYKYVHYQSYSRYSLAESESLKVQLKDILESGTYTGIITRGTTGINVEKGTAHYFQRDVTVIAYRKNDYEGYHLIRNNDGTISYKVLASEIGNIKEVANLYEGPATYERLNKKINYNTENKELKFTSSYHLHLGITNPVFIRELTKDENNIGQTIRYEAATYGNWDFPVLFGLTMQWENNWGSLPDSGKYQVHSLSIGPTIKTKPFKVLTNEYRLLTQLRMDVFSSMTAETTSENTNYVFNQTSLVLGLEREIPTKWGKFYFGWNFQRQWVRPSANQFALDVDSQKDYNDSYVFSIGHGSDWIW